MARRLKAIDDSPPRICGWKRASGEQCKRSSTPVVGDGFEDDETGGLTYWSRFCPWHEQLAAQRGIPTDLIPEKSYKIVDFTLVREDPIACALWLEERHHHWCERIGGWIAKATGQHRTPPSAEVFVRARKEAGWYSTSDHGCAYVLPYAMSQINYDEETIAHEVAHAYQRCLLADATSHGEAWLTVMRLAAGQTEQSRECLTYHAYSVQEAIKLGKALRQSLNPMEAPGFLRFD